MSIIYCGRHLRKRDQSELNELHPDSMVMAIDIDRCIDCHGCEVACLLVEGHAELPRLTPVVQITPESDEKSILYNFPVRCAHCEDPACMNVCPLNAYHKDEDGFVVHDRDKCIGCELCRLVCPYGGPKYHADKRQVVKCDFCIDRVKNGEQPECSRNCVPRAITFGRAHDVMESVKGKIALGKGFMVLGNRKSASSSLS